MKQEIYEEVEHDDLFQGNTTVARTSQPIKIRFTSNSLYDLFVYLVVYSLPEQFFSYPAAVTITGDWAANLDLSQIATHRWPNVIFWSVGLTTLGQRWPNVLIMTVGDILRGHSWANIGVMPQNCWY